jgi:CBS domain-containing protein
MKGAEMQVGSLIRRTVESVAPATSCLDAARRMRDMGVGSLVVAEKRRPLGVLTDRDLVVRVLARGLDAEHVTVGEVMSERPVFVSQSRDVATVLELMRDEGVRRVPVVDDQHELVGVVALDDLVLAVSGQLSAIAEAIRKEL